MWVSDIFTRSTTIRFSHRETVLRGLRKLVWKLSNDTAPCTPVPIPRGEGGGERERIERKEEKNPPYRYVRRALSSFLLFLTRMSSHSHSLLEAIRHENVGGATTFSHKRNASTLVPIIHFYATGCIDPLPLLIGKPQYPVINVAMVDATFFSTIEDIHSPEEKDRKDTPTPWDVRRHFFLN